MGEEVCIWLNILSLIRWHQWNRSHWTFWIYCWELHGFPIHPWEVLNRKFSSIQSCTVNRVGLPSSVISRTMTCIQGWNAVICISSCFSNMQLHKCDSGKRNQCLADIQKALRCVYLFFVSTYAGTHDWVSEPPVCAKLRPVVNIHMHINNSQSTTNACKHTQMW